jgi:multidrug efflux pump subunit AcrA (membrane-fusion protein)
MKVALPGQGRGSELERNGMRARRPSLGSRLRRSLWRLRWAVIVVGLIVVVGLVARQAAAPAQQTATATPPVSSASRLVAHGVVAPVSQARVGSLGGGVLLRLSVAIGDRVEAQTELARVRGASDVEVLTAPFAGTVTGVLAHEGDTLVAGATVVQVADLLRLQVETTDVDEFLIGHVQRGQTVSLQVEALDRRDLSGRVRTVALQPQTTPGGDQHYPVTIDLGSTPTDLRPGMSVRITFPD